MHIVRHARWLWRFAAVTLAAAMCTAMASETGPEIVGCRAPTRAPITFVIRTSVGFFIVAERTKAAEKKASFCPAPKPVCVAETEFLARCADAVVYHSW